MEARLHRVVASAVHVDAPSVLERALGLYLDHPCLPVAVLGRHRPGQEVDALGEPGVEGLTETGNPLGEGHAVDAVLNVRVVSPHMELAVGVIGHTRRLKQYLVEGGLLPLGERVDIVLGYRYSLPPVFGDRLFLAWARRSAVTDISSAFWAVRVSVVVAGVPASIVTTAVLASKPGFSARTA